MTARRIAGRGLVDAAVQVPFQWDGRSLSGHPGDTLASALLANNQWVLGRSFKYHRPRGVMSAGVEEGGALVTLGQGARRDPNVRPSTQELYQGLLAHGQNAWPNVRFDLGAVNNLLGRFFSAGFYYKTFMGLPPFEWGSGTGLWMRYEAIIRRAAGMGEASREPDPDSYEHAHAWCDVMVVGAGPAGLHAALTATRRGLDVLVVEQDFLAGGDWLTQPGADAAKCQPLLAELKAAGARLMTRTTAFGLYDGGVAGLLERVTDHLSAPSEHLPRQRFWTVRARQTILATGALERHFCFANNDRPGIMNCAAARTYLNRYGVLAGDKVVIASNNDSVAATACDLAHAGAQVQVLDARPQVGEQVQTKLRAEGVQLRTGASVHRAQGWSKVSGVSVATADGSGWRADGAVDCDLLLLAGGWSPVVNLMSHRGVKPQWYAPLACFVVPPGARAIHMAGAAAGTWNDDDCVRSGEAAGNAAAAALGRSAVTVTVPEMGGWETPLQPLYEVTVERSQSKGKCFVDPQHDVTSADVRLAHREGFVSVEHLKRYTTLGMATDQGKMGNVVGLALMADALGRDIREVGTTTFRPPYTPVSIGALAGRQRQQHFKPLRRTPLDAWNLAHGAVMTEAGLWRRPWYFPQVGESLDEAYIREASTVRQSVGLCDVTSLGKIAVQGPDATEFLNRIYANPFAKLAIGKARYGIMLRDDGIVLDDGTTWRLSDADYFMTTTTAHAAKVMVWLEELLAVRWPALNVHVTTVSDQWAAVAVAGPKSREVLAQCMADPNEVGEEALPFMGVLQSHLREQVPCRIARISFSGERAFEVYVPSDYAVDMMEMLWREASRVDGCLYGLEALGTLRIEKGHVTGNELDGRATMVDAGLAGMAGKNKSYIGSALSQRKALQDPDRPRLVGVVPVDRNAKFRAGALLCHPQQISGFGEGRISSVTHSPTLGHWIGLGLVSGGYEKWQGQTLIAADPVRDGNIEVHVVSPIMFDPDGSRVRG